MLEEVRQSPSSSPGAMRRLPPLVYGAITLSVIGFGDILLTDNPTLAEFSVPIAAAIMVLAIPELLESRHEKND